MRWLAAGIAALSLVTGSAIAKDRAFDVAEKPALTDVYPERTTRWAGGVTSYADVIYSSVQGFRPLVVDIYTPPKKGAPKPLILYIHGGGWIGGHTRHSGALANFPKVLAQLASEGFVVASLEYRLSGEAPFPAQLQDARAAIRFLKSNAGKYGLDASRVGVWGGSAGGHLAALSAYSCGDTALDPAPAAAGSECVQSLVSWYGVFDFGAMINRPLPSAGPVSPENQLLRCTPSECPADRIAAASPITYIDAKDPPSLLIHGENDAVVNVSQSRLAEAKLRSVGAAVGTIYIPGVDHSFVGTTPASTRKATLKATNATFDFFRKTLQPGK